MSPRRQGLVCLAPGVPVPWWLALTVSSRDIGAFPLDDLNNSVSRLPDDRLSRHGDVLEGWSALASRYPAQVDVSVVAESRQGRPICMATVADDVRSVIRDKGTGGHVTVAGAHACEFLGEASLEVGQWLAPRTGDLARKASFRQPYRVLLSGDVDGIVQNLQYGGPLTLETLSGGIHRPYGLAHCVDYGMPIIDGSHSSLSANVNGRRLPRNPSVRRNVPASMPEAEVLAKLIIDQCIESCLVQHLGFCDMFPFAHVLNEGDLGFAAGVSAVVRNGFDQVNPYDPDWPRKTRLAPGVFLATSDLEIPNSLRPQVGTTIRDVQGTTYGGETRLFSFRYVLPDVPMFRAGRVAHPTAVRRQQALDRGTRICNELILPFAERLDRLQLDRSDRSQEAIGGWLESLRSGGAEPTVRDFIPSDDGEGPASDVEEYTLGDRRVLNAGLRLSEAGSVAASCGDDTLARDIQMAVALKFGQVRQQRPIDRVSMRTLVTTLAYMELLALGGGITSSPFRFPRQVYRTFEAIREQERVSVSGRGQPVAAPYAPLLA